MDLPKNQDCYFYYYSTCRKGKSCTYRHEPSALGHETPCRLWLENKCYNPTCSMRHMKIQVIIFFFFIINTILRNNLTDNENSFYLFFGVHSSHQKPRSATACFFETQPGGCQKPHCVFQHKLPRPTVAAAPNLVLQMPGPANNLILLPTLL